MTKRLWTAVLAGVTLAVSVAIADAPGVGSMAPAFTLTSNEGKPTSLADYKGKVVMLDFWSQF